MRFHVSFINETSVNSWPHAGAATVTPRHYTRDCPLLVFHGFFACADCFGYFRYCASLVYQLFVAIKGSHLLWKLPIWHRGGPPPLLRVPCRTPTPAYILPAKVKLRICGCYSAGVLHGMPYHICQVLFYVPWLPYMVDTTCLLYPPCLTIAPMIQGMSTSFYPRFTPTQLHTYHPLGLTPPPRAIHGHTKCTPSSFTRQHRRAEMGSPCPMPASYMVRKGGHHDAR